MRANRVYTYLYYYLAINMNRLLFMLSGTNIRISVFLQMMDVVFFFCYLFQRPLIVHNIRVRKRNTRHIIV